MSKATEDKILTDNNNNLEIDQEEEDEDLLLEPTLEWIEHSEKLHWIFVGGKGGVGKTTVSCSLSIQLAKRRPEKRILLISTDPAHNVSDALSIKVGKEPTPVPGVPNLQAMEIDSKATAKTLMGTDDDDNSSSNNSSSAANPLAGTPFGQIINQIMPDLKDATSSMPGIDEAMSFAEIMRNVDSMQFDIVLFDTAPTGHTLRLLAMPESVQKLLSKVMSMKSLIMPALSAIMGPAANGGNGFAEQEEKMQKGLRVINNIVEQFKDPDVTTFIPVMIPEFLSLYETERLIQDLHKFNMDVSTIVINQIVPAACAKECSMCCARAKIQSKYIDQAFELYEEDYHIVRLPLGDHEVRGVKLLEQFGADLFKPSPLLPSVDFDDDDDDDEDEGEDDEEEEEEEKEKK